MIINDLYESPQLCPECGGISFSDLILAEKKDACYYKVKASAKVWPSAYASGRLVQCRKKGASNYGNKSESINEFAPSGGDDRGPDDEEILRRLAAQWWSGTEQQMIKAQQTLEALGWEIGPDESGNDDAGVYVYRIGDHDGRDTLAFAHSELSLDEGVAEGLPQTLRKVVPGYAKREIDKKMDAGKFGKTDADKDANFHRYKKIQDKLKEQGVAEGSLEEKSTSQAQFRTMAAAAHNPKFARKVGISQDVAREFNKADKGQDYKKLPARTTEGSLKETDTSRRGFLRGLAAFAASAAVPAPVVKLLSTPTGVASLPIPAGIALLKGIQEHLDQWDPEDDDDYYEAWEDMAGELGFEDEDAGDEYGESAQDKLADIVNLYRENPELAAAQLIQHLQTNVGVSAKEIKPSLGSRADNPNDWRYHNKQKGDAVAGKKESELAKLTRLAAAAQSAANANFQKSAAAAAVKHMGPVQYAKDTPALPAPTKPEFDLAPDLKQKEKVPVNQRKKDDDQSIAEDAELSGILKNAGFKTSD